MKEQLVDLLIKNKYTITTAESCTGGMISSAIVDVSNASKVFNMGFVTYSNEAKIELLGVSSDTLSKYGAVSEEVACEMALGASKKALSDIAIAVSGIAGPSGGSKDKPVGMVCFGYVILDKVYSETIYFGNIGRNNVRNKVVEHALNKVINYLEEGKSND
ncbi:MAG: CinA family protein [Anaeroplasmataceae bacterium]